MRLKRLSLHGYKTFASKTSFEFGEGITAVIGPNGSGKSNIADAIRWVLGEQSYSTLRGKKTADMIFAGSQKRPRAGMAQAILTLDNSEGWLPIDYSEIEICRRAYRSGENEYLLNGNKVRLRDVSELLASSGLARRTYTIIGQGLVDQALSLRADERRMLFEEAAGISAYKTRRAETLRRLQETDHNLERLHDIVSEIKPRLTSLRRQAKRASNYEQVGADLRYHLRIWYGYRWRQATGELRDRRTANQDAQIAWERSRKEQLHLHEDLQRKREQVSKLSESLQKLESDRETQRDELEALRRTVAVLKERKSALERQAAEISDELPSLELQLENANQELEKSTLEMKAAQEKVDTEQEKLNFLDQKTKTQRQQITAQESEVKRLQKELRQTLDSLAKSKGRLEGLRQQQNELGETNQDENELITAQSDLQNTLARLTAKTTEIAKREGERHQVREQLESLNNMRLQLENAINGLEAELNEIRELVSTIVARRDLLGQMRGDNSRLPEKLAKAPKLLDQIKIPARFQVAIEAALGYHLEALIIRNETSLRQLDTEPERRLILLISERIRHQHPPRIPEIAGVIGWASDLVTLSEKSEALKSILSTILIVENRSDALNLPFEVPSTTLVVSIDGLVVYPSGLVEFGSIKAKDSVIAREEEWFSTNQELAVLAERQHSIKRELDATQANLSSIAIENETLIGMETKSAERLENDRLALANIQRETDRSQQKLDQIKNLISARQFQIEKLIKRIESEEGVIEKLEEESIFLQSELEKSKNILDAMPTLALSEQRERQIQQLDSAKTILAGRKAVVDSRNSTLNQVETLLSRRTERLLGIQEQLNQLELEDNQVKLTAIEQVSKMSGMKLAPIRTELADERQGLSRLELKADNIRGKGHELETRFSKARIELGQAENLLESLKERISADLGMVALSYEDNQPEQSPLPMDDIVEHLPEVDELPDDIEDTISRYRGQLTRIGGINPEAPAEYEATLLRYDHLREQIEDLIDTQDRLRSVIEELDEKTSQAFADTVRKVDAVFGDVFKRLFGGGSAKLILTEPENLVDSGVEIVARLPRRREQGLALLSGGERSLTAAALVFALLKVSPTPFCVLDEVDAMLDEANVNRFRDLLQELSRRTQFILITHNRGTVQVAESVYGVSMGSDSVSQVISVKPEDYLVGDQAAP